jgi:putative RNA 2'-phosphotransferase
MKLNLIHVSKTLSYILRHAAAKYDLETDQNGWVEIQKLLEVVRNNHIEWKNIQKSDLIEIVNSCPKQRFELKDEKIRAKYGHSIALKITTSSTEPPPILYHGTSLQNIKLVFKDGLKPMLRQYVHLSSNIKTALEVGYRKSSNPVVIKVYAKKAYEDKINFYIGNEDTWLSDYIPPEYLELVGSE